MENLEELYKTRTATMSSKREHPKKMENHNRKFDPNRKIEIDSELEKYLPPQTEEEQKNLAYSLTVRGYDKSYGTIMLWSPEDETEKYYVVDGHHRYRICRENHIPILPDCFSVLPSMPRDKLKIWMIQNQLSRRNLTDSQRYEYSQMYKELISNKAKQNQSAGGKGCPKSDKVNTTAELAKIAGMSRSKYAQHDAVMQSGEEDLKEKLRSDEISTNKAYEEMRDRKRTVKDTSGLDRIKQIDQELAAIDETLEKMSEKTRGLQYQQETLRKERQKIIKGLNVPCTVAYKREDSSSYKFFIKTENDETLIDTFGVCPEKKSRERDLSFYLCRVPKANKEDFIQAWTQACDEELKIQKAKEAEKTQKMEEEKAKAWEEEKAKRWKEEKQKWEEEFIKNYERAHKPKNHTIGVILDDETRDRGKKLYRTLSKIYHTDSGEGDEEIMKELNFLKERLLG